MLGRPYWWQWPTILSLDAAIVAVLWQGLLAHVAAVSLGWQHAFVLGASVWLAYAAANGALEQADRWIEGWRLQTDQIRTQRHYFYQRWRWPLGFCWLAVLGADISVALLHLTHREFLGGLLLLAPVAVYLLSHQLIHRDHRWRAPKEVCVALLLSGGVSLFLLTAPGVMLRALAAPLGLFTLLCFANCALISIWEKGVDQAHGQTSLALQFRRARGFTRALPWILAVIAVGCLPTAAGAGRDAIACAAASGVLLGVVSLAERRFGSRLARVLADAALLTPILPWLSRSLLSR